MSGWLFIIFLLLLGGLISTLGDLLGSKIGKARFSVLKLRPKKTAILITILTGSLISASSLFLMILVNRQLRVGLFKLGDLQKKLQESKQILIPLEKERANDIKIFLRKEQALIRKEQAERQKKFLQEIKLEQQIEKFRIREIKELEKLEKIALKEKRDD